MPQPLTNRQLNRATLARQWMLERAAVAIPDAIAFLLGLQAQTTNGPYQALWNRLRGFRHEDLTALITDKSLLRATTMRTTLHLHTSADMRAIRPVMQPVLDRTWQTTFHKRIAAPTGTRCIAPESNCSINPRSPAAPWASASRRTGPPPNPWRWRNCCIAARR